MPQTERFGLADKDEVDAARRHGMHQIQKFVLALGRKIGFQFRALVEVIFNGALVTARDEDHVGDTGGSGFFHSILNERLVDHRQHFLGHCLSSGQEAGAQTGNREYSLTNGFHVIFPNEKAVVCRCGRFRKNATGTAHCRTNAAVRI